MNQPYPSFLKFPSHLGRQRASSKRIDLTALQFYLHKVTLKKRQTMGKSCCGKERMYLFTTRTPRKNFKKVKRSMTCFLYLKLFPASRWRASHGRGGRLSLGVGRSHRVPSADQGQAWDKKSPFGEEKRKQETEKGRQRQEGKMWTQGHPEASGTQHKVKTAVSVLFSLPKNATQSSKSQCVII